jgi:DNA invertase Pin-like site-specific DNA recombinase
MPTAHSYLRYSSLRQGEGSTVERQQEMIDIWLKKHPEYVLGGLRFQDLGLSGYHGKHLDNAFGKLLAAVETGAIKPGDFILVESIDRTGRINPNDMLNLLTGITSAGVNIITLDDGIQYNRNPDAANNLFLLVAKVQQAYQYSDAISRRVKDAYKRKRENAANGKFTERRTPLWLENTGTEVKLVEDVAPFIVQIFQDYADGIGERRILARIRGKHPLLESLNPTTIKKWLKNPTAIGRWQPWPVNGVEQAPIEDVYPAVISKELWYRVQKRLASGAKIKSASKVYLLSGLVKCGRCGKNFGVVNTKRSPAAMLCMGRHRLGDAGCSNSRSIPMTVLDFIRSQTMQSAMLRATASQKLTIGEKRLIEIEGELTELHKQSEHLADSLAEFGMLPPIRAKLEKVMESIKKLEREQTFLNVTPSQDTLSDMVDMENILMDDDQQRLNALLQGVGYAIVCDDTTITVDEEHLLAGGVRQVYEYKGSHRPTETYRVIENGRIEHHLDMPNSKRVAALQEEFESTPITQELQWNGKEFIDVATGLVVDLGAE